MKNCQKSGDPLENQETWLNHFTVRPVSSIQRSSITYPISYTLETRWYSLKSFFRIGLHVLCAMFMFLFL